MSVRLNEHGWLLLLCRNESMFTRRRSYYLIATIGGRMRTILIIALIVIGYVKVFVSKNGSIKDHGLLKYGT